jgi:hypothetical protein
MRPNSCAAIQASFSEYLDGAISGQEMQEIAHHMDGVDESACGSQSAGSSQIAGCEACGREFAAWRLTQSAISSLGPARAPADLGLKLRLAISREQAQRSSRLLDRITLAWENAVRPMLVQVSAGLVGAIVLVGGIALLLGMVTAPQAVLANDEPLRAVTAPHYLYTIASPGAIITGGDTAIVVEASVDSTGRVYDYRIVSGPQDNAVRIQVESQLLGRVYQPASVFGLPVRGRVVVTFAGISIHA